MSGEAFDAGLVLAASVAGRALPRSSHLITPIHPNATLVAVRSMAGEDGSIWGVAVGKVGDSRPSISVAADPGVNAEQAQCLAEIGARVQMDPHPSLVVANQHAIALLEAAAMRASGTDDPVVERGANLVRHCAGRVLIAGQDSIISLADALHAHWVWPGQDLCPEDLRRCVAAVKGEIPPLPLSGGRESGVQTPAALDAAKLASLVHKMRREREKSKVDMQMVKRQRVVVTAALSGLLREDWLFLVEGVELLCTAGRAALPGAVQRCAEETRAWSRFTTAIAAGMRLARSESPRRAAVSLSQAERASERFEAELREHDLFARSRGVADGTVLVGEVVAVDTVAETMEVASGQEVLRCRVGDKMTEVGSAKPFVVTSTGECVSLSAEAGVGGIGVGANVELVPLTSGGRNGAKGWAWTHPGTRPGIVLPTPRGGAASPRGSDAVRKGLRLAEVVQERRRP